MNGLVQRMTELVPPGEGGGHEQYDWAAVREALGQEVPPDYMELVAVYGAGNFSEFLQLYAPEAIRSGERGAAAPDQSDRVEQILSHYDLVAEARNRYEALEALWADQCLMGHVIGCEPDCPGRVPGEPMPEGVDSARALVAWAGTDNGEYIFWQRLPDDAPRSRVLVNESRGTTWEYFPMPPSEFLYRLLSGDLRVDLFDGWLLAAIRRPTKYRTPLCRWSSCSVDPIPHTGE